MSKLTDKTFHEIGEELFLKFGTEGYEIRCLLHDLRENVKAEIEQLEKELESKNAALKAAIDLRKHIKR